MKRLMILCLAAAATSPLWAIQGTIRTATDSKKGDIKWQGRSKSYSVSFKKGNTMVSAEYPLDDVTALDIDKPAGYDKAVENVQRGNGAAAIGILTKIVQDYKMLQWDKPAGRYLVEAYLAANNAQKACEIAESIIREDKCAPQARQEPEARGARQEGGDQRRPRGERERARDARRHNPRYGGRLPRFVQEGPYGRVSPCHAYVRRRAVPRGAPPGDAEGGRMLRQARPGLARGADPLAGPQDLTQPDANN